MVRLDITRGHNTCARRSQRQLGFIFTVHDQGDALEVQKNLNNVFLHALDSGVLVQDAVNLNLSYRATGHR